MGYSPRHSRGMAFIPSYKSRMSRGRLWTWQKKNILITLTYDSEDELLPIEAPGVPRSAAVLAPVLDVDLADQQAAILHHVEPEKVSIVTTKKGTN